MLEVINKFQTCLDTSRDACQGDIIKQVPSVRCYCCCVCLEEMCRVVCVCVCAFLKYNVLSQLGFSNSLVHNVSSIFTSLVNLNIFPVTRSVRIPISNFLNRLPTSLLHIYHFSVHLCFNLLKLIIQTAPKIFQTPENLSLKAAISIMFTWRNFVSQVS